MATGKFFNFCTLTIFFALASHSRTTSFRTWKCIDNKCIKEEVESTKDVISIKECKVLCLKYGGLWPRPTGPFHLGNHSSIVDLSQIVFENNKFPGYIDSLLARAKVIFVSRIEQQNSTVESSTPNPLKTKIKLKIYNPNIHHFSTNTDESYKLQVFSCKTSDEILAVIEANTFFGVRHGMETLSQLFFYDDLNQNYKMIDDVLIEDKPEFTHRGIVLDTSRSFISKENILKVLNVLAANKLNTLHWHITDSQSFPYESVAYPELSKAGAYSKNEVYTQNDIKEIVKEAHSLGIRIIPEFDSPAHVGEGWFALRRDLVTCFKWQPWRDYCVQPPCGQLDPTNEQIYTILETIFKEFIDLFQSDMFHLGGDEVNINCWKSTARITKWMRQMNYSESDSGYYKLWGEYQNKILKILHNIKVDPHPQAILWTSTLTQPQLADKYLNPDDYVIQIWTSKNDSSIKFLIDKKFRIIFSNYDELYLDCGGPSWVGQQGQNWCSPYIGWQNIYQHSPFEILQKQGIEITRKIKDLVLGSESAVWTEQIDEHGLHVRLWPRAAALAERLWSNPKEDWTEAQFRMNHHRERLANGAPAELLQPKWCYQNDGFCD